MCACRQGVSVRSPCMNELTQQVQQAFDREGREAAKQVFLDQAVERDWTMPELTEAVALLRSLPKEM